MTRLLGAVIAGGQAQRFGSDKALASWRGKPLIDHVIAAIRPHVDGVLLCGRTHHGWSTAPDRPAPGMGPLGGIAAALHHARTEGYETVLTVGCDTPLLPAALVERLVTASGAAYVAGLPVIGRWPAALADRLDDFLAQDRKHAVRAWAAEIGAEALVWADLPNVNEPGDLVSLGSFGDGMRAQPD